MMAPTSTGRPATGYPADDRWPQVPAPDLWLERQAEPVTLVTMESSGHYWMSLASHLGRHDIPVAVVNPLAAKYFARSRLSRTKSDPADARSRRRPTPPPAANGGPGPRRPGPAGAERLQAAAADSIAVPELDAEVAFEVGLLLDQYDLLQGQIEDADRRGARLLDRG